MPDPTPAKGAPADAKADKPKAEQTVAPGAQPLEEWKPEPRQWTWKDLFTAPMLAFKPKCMLIMALTIAAITAWNWLFDTKIVDRSDGLILASGLLWVQYTVALVLFSLGGSLVAVFLKADLLDDEFLSFGEALGQFRTRIVPAVMVPVFLMGMLAGVYLALVYLPYLAGSIPFVGPAIYALLYPLAFLFSLFVVLMSIAVWLSVFVFPSIIAIRKHGWFDNVVDTIEAVGTKPHVLFASLLLSGVMISIAGLIAMQGISQLKGQWRYLPDGAKTALRDTEARASEFAPDGMLGLVNRHFTRHVAGGLPLVGDGALDASGAGYNDGKNGFYQYVTGPVAGVWQALIIALILGYLGNLFVAGGMLTYLVVREDDYWDDEDLEDLDKLAKELEEEAKRDQGVAEAKPAEPAKAPEAVKPSEPPAAPPAEPAKPAEPPKA
jgi:hypothetical protein